MHSVEAQSKRMVWWLVQRRPSCVHTHITRRGKLGTAPQHVAQYQVMWDDLVGFEQAKQTRGILDIAVDIALHATDASICLIVS